MRVERKESAESLAQREGWRNNAQRKRRKGKGRISRLEEPKAQTPRILWQCSSSTEYRLEWSMRVRRSPLRLRLHCILHGAVTSISEPRGSSQSRSLQPILWKLALAVAWTTSARFTTYRRERVLHVSLASSRVVLATFHARRRML